MRDNDSMGRPSNSVPSCREEELVRRRTPRSLQESCITGTPVSHLIDADFCFHVLQALLNDADEGGGGHKSAVDVGLTDVALYAKGKGRVGEPCRRAATCCETVRTGSQASLPQPPKKITQWVLNTHHCITTMNIPSFNPLVCSQKPFSLTRPETLQSNLVLYSQTLF